MYHKILVPIDGTEISTHGLNEAIKLARNHGSRIRLFHVANERLSENGYVSDGGRIMLESTREDGQSILNAAAAIVAQSGVDVENVLVATTGGSPSGFIIAQAKEWPADLIVMGTHGRRGLSRLAMGSNAEGVVRDAPVPVLLVHGLSNNPVVAPQPRADAQTQYVYA
jgi:nucleotide-binding universal stress UspA family protein